MALKQPVDFCEFYFHAALQLYVAERALGRIAAPRLEHLDHAHDYGYIHNGEHNACAKSMSHITLHTRHDDSPTSVHVSQPAPLDDVVSTASCGAWWREACMCTALSTGSACPVTWAGCCGAWCALTADNVLISSACAKLWRRM